MIDVGLGWAQPLSSPSGSLPPKYARVRTAVGAVVLACINACASGAPVAHTPAANAQPVPPSATSPTGRELAIASERGVVGAPVAPANPKPVPGDARAPNSLPSGSPNDAAPTSLGASSGAGDVTSASLAARDPELARLLALGDGALHREDYASAVQYFRKARRHAPRSGLAAVGLVAARFGQLAIPTEYKGAVGNRDVKQLLGQLATAATYEPELGDVHLQRGRLLVVLGDGKEARVSLTKAKMLLPREPEAHSLLAIVELSEGHVPEALQGFAIAAELDPNNSERLSNWGTALLMHGDIQQAISVFRSAVSLAPNDARARGDLGTALLATSDVTQAMPHLVRACELAPQKATFMSNLGYAHQRQADLVTAKQWYDKALATDPKLGSAWINLGTLYAAQGEHDAAERAFRKALALDPHDPRAQGNLEDLAQLRAAARTTR